MMNGRVLKILQNNGVRLDFAASNGNKHFTVFTREKTYSVIKTPKGYNCDCYHFSTTLDTCSMIAAVMVIENENFIPKIDIQEIYKHVDMSLLRKHVEEEYSNSKEVLSMFPLLQPNEVV